MNLKDIQDKISNAKKKDIQAKTNNVGVRLETMRIEELRWWLGKGFENEKFDSRIIDMAEIFQEKIQFLLFGKPLIIERQGNEEEVTEEESKKVKSFVSKMRLQQVLFANEGNVFNYGRGYIILDQNPNGSTQLRLAEPSFPNTVTRIGQTAIGAVVYTAFMFSMVKYYMKTTYTQEEIKNELFTTEAGATAAVSNLKPIKLKKFNSHLPKQLRIKATMSNPYKFIPVVEITYKPTVDYSWGAKNKLAPINKIKPAQKMLDEGTKALRTELYLNRTKVLVDEDILKDGKEHLGSIAEAGILGVLTDTGGIEGDNKAIEVIQGDPKVQQYWENINGILSITAQSLKLSELNQESADSATGEIFNKGNDVETANTLQIFRQENIAEILTKAWAIENGQTFTEDELNTEEWSVQLIPNVIMNEAKMTEIVIQQLGAGIINMTQAVVKLEGISAEDAKAKLEKDDGIYNPTLEAAASFTDQGEEADQPTTGSGKEVDGGA